MVNKEHTALFTETIYALSSGSLPSGVGVIRVSGPQTRLVLTTLAGAVPEPRQAGLTTLRSHGEVLDRALVLFFPGPASFTGDDVAEFHVHGGRAVVQAVLDAIGQIGGCRIAAAGEFTQRAFLNGKVDLTGAEALADLVAADTEAQRRFALAGAAGAQKNLYTEWQARITRARALVEAELDFSDEQDVPGAVSDVVWEEMGALSGEVGRHLERSRAGEIVRDGFRVVLVGPPNAGKSSLLNNLAQREVAIVTEEAGTTRDLIDVALDVEGYKIVVTDTAGLRESGNKAESIGVARALERVEVADLVLELRDVTAIGESSFRVDSRNRVLIGTKCDLVDGGSASGRYDLLISSSTGAGIRELLGFIAEKARTSAIGGETLAPARARHVDLLRQCKAYIDSAVGNEALPIELRTEALRKAGDSLGRITGAVDVEDLLDVIFSEFCIGK